MYKSKNHLEANALCPFYSCEFKRSITCEGIEIGMSSNFIKFDTEETKTSFVQRYCCRDYEQCKLFKVISDKY